MIENLSLWQAVNEKVFHDFLSMKGSQRSLVVVSLSGFCVVMASASFLEVCVKGDRAIGVGA